MMKINLSNKSWFKEDRGKKIGQIYTKNITHTLTKSELRIK